MKILAIDASTANVGWCTAINDHYMDSGQFAPRGNGFDAVQDYGSWLYRKLFDEKAVYVFYERPSGNRGNMWTNCLLGALWYETYRQVMLIAQLVTVAPSQVKATGYSKELTHDTATLRRNWQALTGKQLDLFKTDAALKRFGDELDAVGVWLAGLKVLEKEGKNEQ